MPRRFQFSDVQRKTGDSGVGDERNFDAVKTTTEAINLTPRALKERRAALQQEIADINTVLAAMGT